MKSKATGILIRAAALLASFGVNADFAYRAGKEVVGYPAEKSTLVNFPVLVRIPSARAKQCRADGADIKFTSSDEKTVYPHEIDAWNPDGESTVWVKLPEMQNGTSFIMHWCDPAYTGPAVPQAKGVVWEDAGYVGVWHMTEESGAVANMTSCLGNDDVALDAVPAGARAAYSLRSEIDAPIGYARDTGALKDTNAKNSRAFLKVANYNNLALKSCFMISGWYYMSDYSTDSKYYLRNARIFSRKTAWDTKSGFDTGLDDSSDTKMFIRGADSSKKAAFTGVPSAKQKWVHIAFVFDGANATAYFNGGNKKTGTIDPATDNGLALGIGSNVNSNGDNDSYLAGCVDEVRLMRITSGASYADWVAAEYAMGADKDFLEDHELSSEMPVLGEASLASAELHGATIAWELIRSGESATDVSFAYGLEEGVYTVTNTLAEGLTSGSADTLTLANLQCGTTYYAVLIAENGSGTVVSAPLAFTTSGAPVFSDVSFVIENGTATASATLTSGAGTAEVTAKCVFGSRVGTPEEIGNWTVTTSPAELTATKTGVSEGHYVMHFEVTSTCPVCSHSSTAVTDDVEASVAGTYEWTGAAGDSCWNTPGNWSVGDVPTAVDTVLFGDGVTADLVVTLPEEPLAAARLIRVTSATPFKIGTSGGPAMPATAFELAEGAGLVTVDAEFDLAADATLTLAADTELDLRSVAGTKNLVIDGEGTVKFVKAGNRTAGKTEVKGGLLLISGNKQLGKFLYIGGDGKPAVARSIESGPDGRPFDIDGNETIVLDGGTFDLETSGVSGHWEKEHCGPITVYKGGKFLPGKRRVQLSTGGVPVLTLEGVIEGGSGAFNFPDNSSLVVPATADAAPEITSGVTVTQQIRFNIADIPDASVDTTISGSIGFGWASRDAFWKTGAGVLRLTGKNTYGGGGELNQGQGTTQLQEGALLVDNDPSVYGSGTGNSLVRVDGGTMLGGTGRIGGLTEEVTHWSGNKGNGQNTRVTAKGTDGKQAVIWPGTIGAEGEHVNGALTVGIDEILAGEEKAKVLHHPVTFGDYSTLKASFGAAKTGAFDALVVNGAVDISATGTKLELVANCDLAEVRGGTYTILSAADGITGDFAEIVRPKNSWRVNKVVEDDVVKAVTVTIVGKGFKVIYR